MIGDVKYSPGKFGRYSRWGLVGSIHETLAPSGYIGNMMKGVEVGKRIRNDCKPVIRVIPSARAW